MGSVVTAMSMNQSDALEAIFDVLRSTELSDAQALCAVAEILRQAGYDVDLDDEED